MASKGKHPPRMRTREARVIRWFFEERLGAWQIPAVEALASCGEYHAAFYLMLVSLEMLSGFRAGGPPGAAAFNDFIETYFDPILSTRVRNPLRGSTLLDASTRGKKTLTYAEIARAFFSRGFESACAPLPGMSIVPRSRYYCRFYRRIGLRIDAGRFHADFLRACRSYQNDVVGDYFVRRMFIRRFTQLFGGLRIPRGR